ncbi:MAG: hypothetical protein H8D97_00810 [Proteobacteria bacterium]|nr:hypothetical protein [Pseudomonadota bacterium]
MEKLLKLVHKKDGTIPLIGSDKFFSFGYQKHRIIFTLENIHMVQTFINKPSIIIEDYKNKSFTWLSGVEPIVKYFKNKTNLKNEFQFKLEEYILNRI